MDNLSEQLVLGQKTVEDFVRYLMQPDPADADAFSRRVRGLLAELDSQPMESISSDHPVAVFRRWLRESPGHQVMSSLQAVRRNILLADSTSAVPVVAAVVTLSLVWETGHRIDHVVVPSATQQQPELTLSMMAAQLPTVVTNILYRLSEVGLDSVRKHEAYLMDAERFEVLMGVLDAHIANRPDETQAPYRAIVDRMRLLMQVMSEEDLRSR